MARQHWPGAERVLPRLGRAANHGVLWLAGAGALAVFGSPRARRAAARAAASLALASATINTVGKWSVRRPRPLAEVVPAARRPTRFPTTTSFPSGHSASAFAFATGLALEHRGWGAVAVPVAAGVAVSRVYTGVHYPADVLAGAALGVGAALCVRSLARAGERRRAAPGPEQPATDAPALPDGAGLVVVANTGSGVASGPVAGGAGLGAGFGAGFGAGPAEEVRAALAEALPAAEFVACTGEELVAALEEAAGRCRVLGICGGDGSVSAAATIAQRAGLPLAVFPGGTLNHFAADLGLPDAAGVCRAVAAGEAVRVSVGRLTPGPGPDGRPVCFVNTFSLGVYPELVRRRERWAPRIGGGPAALLAAWRVLREERPVSLTVAGRPRSVWLLFAGNGTYYGSGPVPRRRFALDERALDVRLAHGGGRPGPRLLAAAMTGPLTRSPLHTATRRRSLPIADIPPGTLLAYDGEYAAAPTELVVEQLPGALVVYRPYGVDAGPSSAAWADGERPSAAAAGDPQGA
ncbi:bifunctional phosphatase PAP2/diacylglycerol kinase family protein [Streptomyces sp. NRRL S-87]|uniref:bifunctional phosphatase PAP2/diacylglycerol kinase family protein n=1 Tax=Streptomyces sp. NRRL S-87 TaxID=1463920 RepID=UPI001F2FB6B6|nr:bifunctional phosphatase PAP2/diacylglycerol kinase family protein [Streptomyces sp. NRRL S-87]